MERISQTSPVFSPHLSDGESSSDSDSDYDGEFDHQTVSDDSYDRSPTEVRFLKRKRSYNSQNRSRSCPANKKMRKRWDDDIDNFVSNVPNMRCCKKLECFRNCNISFLKSKITSLRHMSYESRRLTIMDWMTSSSKIIFDGKQVCNTFLKKAFRVSPDLISSIKKGESRIIRSQSNSSNMASEATSNSDRQPLQRDAIISCLERMAETSGDRMPDWNEIHLPFFKKRDVYFYLSQEFKILYPSDVKVPSKSYFYSTWKKYCRNIKVRKLGRFAKCSTCEHLRKSIHDALCRKDFKTVHELRSQKTEHNEFIARERREYKKKRDYARLQPNKYLSIIVDGADQSAFGLPHFMIKTKDDRGHSLKVRLIGLLEHNQQNKLRLFTLTEEFPTGANHVVEAIHRFLSDRVHSSELPRTFYIQVDNCVKENKNRFLFAYIESLIRWNLFDEILVSFLPVGHTHEDIDQTFSRTSDRLRCNDAITLEDLHGELRTVYNNQTFVGSMNQVVNWSGLCQQEKCLSKVKNFSKYRYFKFFKKPRSEEISCFIRFKVGDDWFDIANLSEASIPTFSNFTPDLNRTPPLEISCPEGALTPS